MPVSKKRKKGKVKSQVKAKTPASNAVGAMGRSAQLQQHEAKQSSIRRIVEWTLSTVTIVGLVVGLAVFWPRFTIEPAAPFDPATPAPATFRIANTGLIPLRNLQPSLGICQMASDSMRANPNHKCLGEIASKFKFIPWFRPWLAIDEKYDIAIEELFEGLSIGYADIAISVAYNPWHLPITLEKQFRFETRKLSDGKMYWFGRPIE